MQRIESTPVTAKIDAGICFFMCVLLFWLPYSGAVIETCVVISTVLWLVKRIILIQCNSLLPFSQKAKIFKPQSSALNLPIALFFVACLLSVPQGMLMKQSLIGVFGKTLRWFLIYFLMIEVFKSRKQIFAALGILFFTSFSTAIDGIIQYYITGKDFFLGRDISTTVHRATAGFNTPNDLAAYLSVVVLLGVSVFLSRMKGLWRILWIIPSGILVWAMFVTFSRGAWMGVFWGMLFVGAIYFWLKKNLKKYVVYFIPLLLLIPLIIKGPELFKKMVNPEMAVRGSVDWRLDVWKDSLAMFKEKPVLGHGVNTFMRTYEEYKKSHTIALLNWYPTYAHNCYLQILVETGIVGLILFLWVLASLFNSSLDRIKNQYAQRSFFCPLSIGLLAGIFAFLFHSFLDTQFYSLQLSSHLWASIGLLVAMTHQS
ncbi:MAG: O-antigen ligase family protein [Candidatus Omnitrophica bacterium]|nr:O-antigen ligase family protein [Candidatus Omnitrophota bacterium]